MHLKSKHFSALSLSVLLGLTATASLGQSVVLPLTVVNASGGWNEVNSAVDGNPNTMWNSQGPAPQFIEVDLGSDRMFSRVRLLPAQSDPGYSVHRIIGKTSAGQEVNFTTYGNFTKDNQWIEIFNQLEIPVRYVRVLTTQVNSWVAWREIQVYDGGDLSESCYSNEHGYGWAIYATLPGSSKCPDTQGHFLVKYRDVRNQPSGTLINSCSLYGLQGWTIVSSSKFSGQCDAYQNSERFILRKD